MLLNRVLFPSLVLLGATTLGASCAYAADKTFPGTGVALTPRNFPRHSPEDVRAMFDEGKEFGEYAVFIYQWSQPDFLNVAKIMIDESRKRGYTPIVGLSPTVLSGVRDEWDVPESVRRKVKGKLSMSNPDLHLDFIEKAIELAKLKPDYLCLAPEINFMAFKNIKEYVTFAGVYKKLYPVIKKESPDTKVFVSWQWDFYRIMDDKNPKKVKENSKLIDIFRPELDLVAFTSYPADHFSSPDDIPSDYYARIYDHVERRDEVMFMEIGWPTTGKGSDREQVEFIERLPALMKNVRPRVLAWSLLHDVRGSGLNSDLATTGLRSSDGKAKSEAAKAFRDLRNK
jgi:hypothetical protein